MNASGDRINYSVRPSKSVERKIIFDSLASLRAFKDISKYKYIGFGSKYFSDFKIAHKNLHIDDLVSIESDVGFEEKYRFNRPFSCIDLKMGKSTDILGGEDLSKELIAWLDYDAAVSQTMLDDVGIILESVQSGSSVLVTYNSRPFKLTPLREEYKSSSALPELLRRKLGSMVAEEFLPRNIPQKGLSKEVVFSKVVREIFLNKIESSLINKNQALDSEDKWNFKQVMYFNYRDGAPMSTIAWVFYQTKDVNKYNKCEFETQNFYRDGDDAYSIGELNLTLKEISLLQQCMPLVVGDYKRDIIPEKIFPDEVLKVYSDIYKYYPSFVDVEMA